MTVETHKTTLFGVCQLHDMVSWNAQHFLQAVHTTEDVHHYIADRILHRELYQHYTSMYLLHGIKISANYGAHRDSLI